ncbi:hypothetical protein [Microbacterium sp. CH1]|uniref:hypothetical protein n=1 Tax=Microbacterium sp. CH1 TaxID=1770208 RepID=UPI0007879EF8|nr:hypothetical protein [Microbacterium sp. CH1]KYJ97538.1 hypothetical protein AUV07_15030 [Microbacterium sp. CH1]
MGILDKLLISGSVALAGTGITKIVKSVREESRRRNTPPEFDERLTQSEFLGLVEHLARTTPRVLGATVDGQIVKIHVRSNSGLTTWSAELDFNDYGHLTGTYWIRTENDQSPIPEFFASALRDQIQQRIT